MTSVTNRKKTAMPGNGNGNGQSAQTQCVYACTSPTPVRLTQGRRGLCPEWAILTVDGLYLWPRPQI